MARKVATRALKSQARHGRGQWAVVSRCRACAARPVHCDPVQRGLRTRCVRAGSLTDRDGDGLNDLGVGGFTVKCTEYDLGNASFMAWAEVDVGAHRYLPAATNDWGAANRLPDHVPGTVAIPSGYPDPCEPLLDVIHFVGFDHEKVNTRNLSVIQEGRPPADCLTHHCLGFVWSEGGKLGLFSLLGDNHVLCKDDLCVTSDNLVVNDLGELLFGDRPNDRYGASRFPGHFASCPGPGQ